MDWMRVEGVEGGGDFVHWDLMVKETRKRARKKHGKGNVGAARGPRGILAPLESQEDIFRRLGNGQFHDLEPAHRRRSSIVSNALSEADLAAMDVSGMDPVLAAEALRIRAIDEDHVHAPSRVATRNAESQVTPALFNAEMGLGLGVGVEVGEAAEMAAMLVAGTNPAPKDAFGVKDRALNDAMRRYSNVRARTREWLHRMVDALYRGKKAHEEANRRQGEAPTLTFPQYLFVHLRANYGTKQLVEEKASEIMTTLRKFYEEDPFVGLFYTFLREAWDPRVLSLFFAASDKLRTPCPVRCIEYPFEDGEARFGGGKGMWVCHAKAVWAIPVVLGAPLPEDTSKSLAQSLAMPRKKSATYVPTLDDIMWGYRAGGGMQNQGATGDLAGMLEVSGEFIKIQATTFYQTVCETYARALESLPSSLPALFRSGGPGAFNGQMSRGELEAVVEVLVPQGDESRVDRSAERAEHADKIWRRAAEAAAAREKAGAEGGGGGAPKTPPGAISFEDFSAAACESKAVVEHVLRSLPPAVDGEQEETKEGMQEAMEVLAAQWVSKERLMQKLFAMSGAEEAVLRSQALRFLEERDANVKLRSYAGLLMALVSRVHEQIIQSRMAPGMGKDLAVVLRRYLEGVAIMYGLTKTASSRPVRGHRPKALNPKP